MICASTRPRPYGDEAQPAIASTSAVAALLPSACAGRASAMGLLDAVEARIHLQKYIAPDYQHVDGTSFAAPVVASVVAQMLEANPRLTLAQVRDALVSTARPLHGVPGEQQGAGVVDPAAAVAWVVTR